MVKAYLAGPLFKKEEQENLEQIDKICKALNIETFLPHRDVGVYQTGKDSKPFFEADKKPLDECNLVIALFDWKGIGSGTAWEIGYAYARGIPVIALVEDLKTVKTQERICVMCLNSAILVENLEQLKEEIKKLI